MIYEQQSAIRIGELVEREAKLLTHIETLERQVFDLKFSRDEARAERDQARAECARLRDLLERVLNGKVHIEELRQALKKERGE
jgi:hypothetical protein